MCVCVYVCMWVCVANNARAEQKYFYIKRKIPLLWYHYQFISDLWLPSSDGVEKYRFVFEYRLGMFLLLSSIKNFKYIYVYIYSIYIYMCVCVWVCTCVCVCVWRITWVNDWINTDQQIDTFCFFKLSENLLKSQSFKIFSCKIRYYFESKYYER